ncbi:hypothetical protein AX17_007082 [Amanita inopinata Kibby_2008]|nr:hypothetical protein AX17_007082 [Amanita inopinata Kibby_2008]
MDTNAGQTDDSETADCHIDKLPSEVLGLIFDQVTCPPAEEEDEPASAALALSHVCHRWKHALTPSHWATVRVRHLNHSKTLKDILSRSQNHELDIAIRLGHVEADYYWPRKLHTVKIQWKLYDLFHALADNQSRLRRLTVEANQGALAWFEEVIIERPLTLTHLTLIQVDREIHMHHFSPPCFDLSSCTSLNLVHTYIMLGKGVEWPLLRELHLADINSYELIGWTYNIEMDDGGQFQYESKAQNICFASVRSLSISNTFFIKKKAQIVDFFALFPNVIHLELDCIDAQLVLETLEKDCRVLPSLQRVAVDGMEVYSAVIFGNRGMA